MSGLGWFALLPTLYTKNVFCSFHDHEPRISIPTLFFIFLFFFPRYTSCSSIFTSHLVGLAVADAGFEAGFKPKLQVTLYLVVWRYRCVMLSPSTESLILPRRGPTRHFLIRVYETQPLYSQATTTTTIETTITIERLKNFKSKNGSNTTSLLLLFVGLIFQARFFFFFFFVIRAKRRDVCNVGLSV